MFYIRNTSGKRIRFLVFSRFRSNIDGTHYDGWSWKSYISITPIHIHTGCFNFLEKYYDFPWSRLRVAFVPWVVLKLELRSVSGRCDLGGIDHQMFHRHGMPLLVGHGFGFGFPLSVPAGRFYCESTNQIRTVTWILQCLENTTMNAHDCLWRMIFRSSRVRTVSN